MIWRRMTADEARIRADDWDAMPYEDFLYAMDNWTPTSKLSIDFNIIVKKMNELDSATKMSSTFSDERYSTDLRFALGIYHIFTEEYGMTAIEASDDGIWRYIQMDLVPGMIYNRWPGKDDRRINDDRQWKNTRRIWLKTLWFYIHLSWQGSLEETRAILSNNVSNDISQLVERSGSGYRLDLYREIMKQYAYANCRGELGRILKLNVAWCGTVEPLLSGNLEKYVSSLFDDMRSQDE